MPIFHMAFFPLYFIANFFGYLFILSYFLSKQYMYVNLYDCILYDCILYVNLYNVFCHVIRFTWTNKHYLLLWGTLSISWTLQHLLYLLSISWTLQHLLYLLRAVTSWTLDPHYFLPLPPSISPLTPPGPPASRICLPPGPSASRMRPSISTSPYLPPD